MIDDLDLPGKQNAYQNIEKENSNKVQKVTDISNHDLERIVSRVIELTNNNGMNTDNACIGTDHKVCTGCGQCASKNPSLIRQMIEQGATRISHRPGSGEVPMDLAGYIDHTILKPDATVDEIKTLCKEAREYKFASVCVNPSFVPLAKKELAGTSVLVCTVVGFPLGAHMSDVKAMETRRAIRDGAKEIDMVINIGALKSGDLDLVYKDIRAVTEACEDGSATSKVIIETALLTDEEKKSVCEIAKRARANFVKTSTGFASGGATEADVALMSGVVSATGMGVKASGGIKNLEDAQKMIAAGATRIGASAGVKIVKASGPMTISH